MAQQMLLANIRNQAILGPFDESYDDHPYYRTIFVVKAIFVGFSSILFCSMILSAEYATNQNMTDDTNIAIRKCCVVVTSRAKHHETTLLQSVLKMGTPVRVVSLWL